MFDYIRKTVAVAARYRSYPRYKDSGEAWLGRIPTQWRVKRLKYSAPIRTSEPYSKPVDEIYIGLEHVESWTGRLYCEIQPDSVESAVRKFKAGDVLFGKLRPYLAKVARPSFNGVSTNELIAFFPTEFLQDYLYYSLLNASYIQWVDTFTYGTKMPRVSPEQVENGVLPIPSKVEQQAIAAFLDRETAKIDALVTKKEQLIEVLEEKRSALVAGAVTKGLDATVPMKDSDVEWLGDIPKHWNCIALTRVTLSRCDGPFGSGIKSEHYSNEGVRVIRLQNISGSSFLDSDQVFIEQSYADTLGDHSVFDGDLLIAGLGDDSHPVGRACVAPGGLGQAMVKADCFRFRIDQKEAVPVFMAYQLSDSALSAVGHSVTGSTRLRMNLNATASRKVALPGIQEQHAIVEFLDIETTKIDELIAKVRRAIDGLKEMRTALISAAVTGTIDVREAAR